MPLILKENPLKSRFLANIVGGIVVALEKLACFLESSQNDTNKIFYFFYIRGEYFKSDRVFRLFCLYNSFNIFRQ